MSSSFIKNLFTRFVGTVFRRGTTIEVAISQDLMARLSVVDSVAVAAASSRDMRAEDAYVRVTDDPPVSVAQGIQHCLDTARPVLRRCAECDQGNDLAPIWLWDPPTGRVFSPLQGLRDARLQASAHGVVWNVVDELAVVMPFLCPHALANRGVFSTPIGTPPAIILPYRAETLFDGAVTHKPGCNPPDFQHLRFDVDGLGHYLKKNSIYRYNEIINPLCCTWCRPEELHGANPDMFSAPIAKRTMGKCAAGESWIKAAWMINVWLARQDPRPARIHLTGWNSRYCPVTWIPNFGLTRFVLTMTPEDSHAVLEAGMIPLQLIVHGGARSLGNARLWVAAAVSAGTIVLCSNAYLRDAWLFDLTVPQIAPVECLSITLKCAGMGVSLIVGGAVPVNEQMTVSRGALLGAQYAIEEAVLVRSSHAVTRVDHFFEASNTRWDYWPEYRRKFPLTLRSMVTGQCATATGVSRAQSLVLFSLVRHWARRANRGASWTGALTAPLGKHVPAGPVEVQRQPSFPEAVRGTPRSISSMIAAQIGVVNWFVFGSRGDVVPILAVARHMRGWGIDVRVVRVHSEDEGNAILAFAEQGDLLSAAPYFVHTFAAATTAPGLVFGPPEFTCVDMGVSLRPPHELVHPVDFRAGPAVNFVIDTLLRGWAPLVHIGAYKRVHWLPRSADGENFLPADIPQGNRPIDIMLAWGSSSLPPPVIDGAVVVPSSDHVAEFAKAKVVVCSGSAGTVQTAAARGAAVVSGTVVLDRRYRDPLNAGAGVQPGADPDLAMLTLLPFTPLVWIWAWRHSWVMSYRAVMWYARWRAGPAIWLGVALFVRSMVIIVRIPRVRLVFASSLPSTLMATVMSSVVPAWFAVWVAPFVESLISYVLRLLGIDYVALLMQTISLLGSASFSPLTWMLIMAGYPALALPVFISTSWLSIWSTILAEVLSWVFSTRAIAPDGGYCSVGVSLAFRGLYIPVFHTRFINVREGLVLEGQWVSYRRGLGALYSLQLGEYRVGQVDEWVIETAIPWAKVAESPRLTAPYSPLWNCQSAMLHTVRGAWGLLGGALFILAPVAIFAWIAVGLAMLGCAITMFLMDTVPVLALAFAATGNDGYNTAIRIYTAHYVDVLTANPHDLFGTALAALVGATAGWSEPNTPEGRSYANIVCRVLEAKTVAELQAVLVEHGDMPGLAKRLWNLKVAMYAEDEQLNEVGPYDMI